MKKIFSIVASLLIVLTASAANYEKAAGVEVGGINGISYKQFFTDNLALQCDLTVGLLETQGSWSKRKGAGKVKGFDFKINPNVVYQMSIGAGFDFYAGGGIGFGLYHSDFKRMDKSQNYGKFGINAIAGVEYVLNSAPIVLGLNFRPGYGVAFTGNEMLKENYGAINYFDWGLGFSVRYIL